MKKCRTKKRSDSKRCVLSFVSSLLIISQLVTPLYSSADTFSGLLAQSPTSGQTTSDSDSTAKPVILKPTTGTTTTTTTTTTVTTTAETTAETVNENTVVETLSANNTSSVGDTIKTFEESEKDAYAIITNKYMTETEYQAFEWSFILSQFAVPYKENIVDVLSYTSFQDMDSENLTISDNPYTEAIKAITNSKIDSAMKSKSDSETTNFKELFQTLSDESSKAYTQVVVNGGEPAYLSDLFEEKCLFVKDKVALAGSSATSSTLWEAVQTLGEDTVYASQKLSDFANSIKTANKIVDTMVPVWVMTDSTIMYNSIFVANAIRMGNYKDYDTFINSIGEAPLFVDRWGDICAYISLNGTYKYCIVYPNYCNPIYTSTSLGDDDYAGFYCDDIGSTDAWTKNSADGSVSFNSDNFKIKVAEAKEHLQVALDATEDENKQLSSFLGAGSGGLDSDGSATNFADNYLLDSQGLNSSEKVYTRMTSTFTGNLPIVASIDTSTNFIYNKAIMAAYTRDSTDAAKDISTDFYNCFNKDLTAYSTLNNISDYKLYDDTSSSYGFKDNIVFDKFFVEGKISTSKGQDSLVKLADGIEVNDSNMWLSLAIPGLSGNNYKAGSAYGKIQTITDMVSVKDSLASTIVHKTLYPFMLMHSYRKGIYSDYSTLSSTSTGALVDVVISTPVCISWNLENTVSSPVDVISGTSAASSLSDGYYVDYHSSYSNSGSSEYMISTLNLESIWNLVSASSDSYKTYITFNYSAEDLPTNTALSGISTGLKNERELPWYKIFSADPHYNVIYTDEVTDDAGKKYISFPILDNVIDACEDWSIFSSTSSSTLRDRSSMNATAQKSKGLLTGVSATDSNNNSFVRYYLNDTRVSDLLENYPLDDFVLLAFIWRNYYLDQSPIRTRVTQIEELEVEETEETATTTTPAETTSDGDVTTTSEEESEEPTNSLTLNSETKEFTLGDDYIYPKDTVLCYPMIADESFNNEILFTTECDSETDSLLWTTTTTNNTTTLKLNKRGYYVRYNMADVILAVNKNMNADSILYYESVIDESTKKSTFNTDELIQFLTDLKDNPGLALTNLVLSVAQLVHNNVAVGNICNLFDVSWVLTLGDTSFLQTYMILSAMAYIVLLFIYALKYLVNKKQTSLAVILEPTRMLALGMVPVLVIAFISEAIQLISKKSTQNIASSLVSIEVEKKIRTEEDLDLDFETAYTIFRQQFDEIGDSYSNLTLDIVTNYNQYTDEITYETIDVSQLYENVSYDTLLSSASGYAKTCEAQAEANGKTFKVSDTSNDIYESSKGETTPLYYSYEQFVPVNYKHYSESIFYYFYDWLKYQYLAYWANNDQASNSAFTAAAQSYSLPAVDKDETWSSYINRMWDAEKTLLVKSYYGCYTMYNDDDYVTGSVSDEYVQDLFGLSNLFHMTRQYRTGAVGVPDYTYMQVDNSDTPTLSEWSGKVISQCEDVIGDYTSYCQSIKKIKDSDGTDTDTLTNVFYPIAFISQGSTWNLYSKSKAISINSSSDELRSYCFTPTYLNETFVAEDSDYGKLWRYLDAYDNASGVEACGRSAEASYISTERIPWRVYGTKAKLNDNGLSCDSKGDTTDLERKLNNLTETILEKVQQECDFMDKDIRDSSLIFNAALTATFEFNKTFYGDSLFSEVEPTSLSVSSIDLDKLMRVVFARNMDEIDENYSTMYMIYDSQGNNIFTVLALLIAELEIMCTIVLRFGIMFLIFLGSILLFLSFAFAKPVHRREIIIGLASNTILLLASHLAMLGTIMIGMELISKSATAVADYLGDEMAGNVASAIVATIFALVYFVLLKYIFKLFTTVAKDINTFGGSIISDKLYSKSVNMRVDKTTTNTYNYDPEVLITSENVEDEKDSSNSAFASITEYVNNLIEARSKKKTEEEDEPLRDTEPQSNSDAVNLIISADKFSNKDSDTKDVYKDNDLVLTDKSEESKNHNTEKYKDDTDEKLQENEPRDYL